MTIIPHLESKAFWGEFAANGREEIGQKMGWNP